MYLTQTLHNRLREIPADIASLEERRERSWHEVGERAMRFAGMLRGLGLVPGGRVALLAHNGGLYLDYFFGTLWAGGVLNPVNTRWAVTEIAHSLADSGTGILILTVEFLPLLAALRAAAPCLHHVLLAEGAAEGIEGVLDLESAIAAAPMVEDALRRGEDLAALLYTSGTTGRPKGVMLSHRAMISASIGSLCAGEGSPGTCMLHTAPLFHVGGLSGLISALLSGASNVFVPSFEPGKVMTVIEARQVSGVFLVPTMLHALLSHPDFMPARLSSLRFILYGGAPMPRTLLEQAIAQMPWVGFLQAYGMTELSPVVSVLPPSSHRPEAISSGIAFSAGRATPLCEIKIVDPEDRKVPRGQSGEIIVRGPGIMTGYWNMPEASAQALRGGWMHTGDIGRLDDHGYLYVLDRAKDMIVTGGENVFSVEVEGALMTHPAVSQAAVVGVPDERWGERVHAIVVFKPGLEADEAELVVHCRTLIAGYKIPRGFSFTDALPLSGTGKVNKASLRSSIKSKKSTL